WRADGKYSEPRHSRTTGLWRQLVSIEQGREDVDDFRRQTAHGLDQFYLSPRPRATAERRDTRDGVAHSQTPHATLVGGSDVARLFSVRDLFLGTDDSDSEEGRHRLERYREQSSGPRLLGFSTSSWLRRRKLRYPEQSRST